MNKENILSSEGNLHNNTQSFPPNKFTRWKADLLLYKKVVVSLNSPPPPIFIEYFDFSSFGLFSPWQISNRARAVLGVDIDFVLLFIHCSLRKSKNGRESIRSNDLNTQQITERWSLNRCLLLNRFIDHYYRIMTAFITRLDNLLKVFLKLLWYALRWKNTSFKVSLDFFY